MPATKKTLDISNYSATISLMKLYPLKFRPIFKERIWGGRRLREVFGKNLPANTRIGESWELADLPDNKSEIINGPLKGQTLNQVLASFGPRITGIPDYQPPFPLLIKILDAQDDLSVQVHPDADTCRRQNKGQPKNECLYIIDAEPGAIIYKGLKPGTTKDQFAKAIANGTCQDYLLKVPVHIGECHFLPAGICHAIGAGLLIAEIQQPSDTTYRVFDWDRIDPATGKARPLHIKDALESIHFDSADSVLTIHTVGRLVNTGTFRVDKGHQATGCEVLLTDQMKAIMILSGSGQITGEGIEPVPFKQGDTLLIPAAFEGVMQFKEECRYLVTTLG